MKFRNPKLFAPHARRIAILIVCVCMATVFGAGVACWYFAPEKVARREFERIAKDYYENYFYGDFFGNLTGEERKVAFTKYAERGLPPTYLRLLLKYDNGKHSDSAPLFKYTGYTCDTNSTYVVFYPTEPFEAKDYTMKIEMSCN